MNVGVVGLGGVGGLIASLMCLSDNKVFVFGSDASDYHMERNGLELRSGYFGDHRLTPFVGLKTEALLDVVFITVKFHALAAALEKVRTKIHSETVLLSLLNGTGHQQFIKNEIGHKFIGTIGAVESWLDRERVVNHTSSGMPHVEFASSENIKSSLVEDLIRIIESARISVSVFDSENEVVWRKLVRLSAIAVLTSAFKCSVGEIFEKKQSHQLLDDVVAELCQIANLFEVKFEPEIVSKQIRSLPHALKTSLQRDLEKGDVSELESIVAEPIRLGKNHGLNLPALDYCYNLISLRSGS